jgi:hypothetical protein
VSDVAPLAALVADVPVDADPLEPPDSWKPTLAGFGSAMTA